MLFEPYGPFPIARSNGRLDRSSEARKLFWQGVEDNEPGLSYCCGCYIFSIKTGRGSLPWYVGRAERQPFVSEVFAHHKWVLYNEALRSRGVPQIYLLAKLTPGDKFAKPTKAKDNSIRFLERNLIGMALARNKNLKNLKDTAIGRNLKVPGIINSDRGQPTRIAADLKKTLGLRRD